MLGSGLTDRRYSPVPVKVSKPVEPLATGVTARSTWHVNLTAIGGYKTYANPPGFLTLTRLVSSITKGEKDLIKLSTSTVRAERCVVSKLKSCRVTFWPIGASERLERSAYFMNYAGRYDRYIDSGLVTLLHVVAPPGHQVRVRSEFFLGPNVLYFAPFDPMTGYVNTSAIRTLTGPMQRYDSYLPYITLNKTSWTEPARHAPIFDPTVSHEIDADFTAHYVRILQARVAFFFTDFHL